MSKFRGKLLIGLGIFAVLFTLVIVVTINFHPTILSLIFRDIPPIDDSDLKLEEVVVPKEENAYYELIKIERELKITSEDFEKVIDHVEDEIWDEGFVGKILSENESALEHLDEAADKPKFQDPAYADPSEITLETSVVSFKPKEIINVSDLNSLRALRLVRQGKIVEAYDEALKPANIGQKIHESQASLIHFLVGSAMKAIALETERQLLNSTNVSSETLTQYVKKFDKFKNNKDGLTSALKGEYHVQSNAVDSILKGDYNDYENVEGAETTLEGLKSSLFKPRYANSSFYFQPNKTKSLLATYTREAISNLDKPCSTVKYKEIERLSSRSFTKMMFTENAVGKIIHDIVAISLGKINSRLCQENLLISSTQLAFALGAYKNDTGGLPDSLGQLAPKYISDVPKDPYDGKSIRYNATKKIIYSVGDDGVDSGGSQGDDWSKMKDPTVKIDF